MLSCSLGSPGSRLRQGLVFRMFIRSVLGINTHGRESGGRIETKAKSSCDASLTASASCLGSYEAEMAHQVGPCMYRENLTLSKSHILPATEAMPEEVIPAALPEAGESVLPYRRSGWGNLYVHLTLVFTLCEMLLSSSLPG